MLLGLDLGTTTIKAVIYDPEIGKVVRTARRSTPLEHPRPDWSEYDPQRFWKVTAECLREAAEGYTVNGLGVSSMGETGLPLDRYNQPLYPLIAWHDRRGQSQVNWWEDHFSLAAQHGISGQRVNTSFGAIKWLWFKQNQPQKADMMNVWLSLPDYLLFCLTGSRVTDPSIASRTLLMDQGNLDWSDGLLQAVGLDRRQLPEIRASGSVAGYLTPLAAEQTGLKPGTPCLLGGHDHLCAALAAGALDPGVLVDSMGTAEALVMVLPYFCTGEEYAGRSFACYAHVVGGRYILKGGLPAAGMALEWTARQLLGCSDPNIEPNYQKLEQEAAPGVGVTAGPVWLPHWNGSGSPEADRFSRAAMIGVRSHHSRGDLFRGLLESMAFWTRHNLEEMEALTGLQGRRLVISGGSARLNLLVQLKADVLNRPVEFPDQPESAALGAALLAGVGLERFSGLAEALTSVQFNTRVFLPDPRRVKWYEDLYQGVYKPLYGSLAEVHQRLAEISGEKS